jgi:hypothetical protein
MEGAPNNDPQAARLRIAMGRVEELRRAGKHEEAQQLAERLRAAGAQRPQANPERNVRQPAIRGQVRERQRATPPARPVAQARVTMQRLSQAAGLLQSAGYPEHAAKVRQEIERIAAEARREAETARTRAADDQEKARREAAEKADAGMREEMKKLRREVEELRAQLKKMKDRDTGSRTP